MNILKPITTLFQSGTVLRDMLIDTQSQDILTYLTPNSVMFVDITNKLRKKSEEGVDTEIFGPFQTTFGNPAPIMPVKGEMEHSVQGLHDQKSIS